jgi:hypothetical protein
MIRVPGTLIVNRRNGRNGSFSVGDLVTDVGEFKVKDTALDQYEPGEYKGEFIIKWIEPHSNVWRGRVYIENRASLQDIIIFDAVEDDGAAEASAAAMRPPETDPLEEGSGSSERPAVALSSSGFESSPATPDPLPHQGNAELGSADLTAEQRALLGDELAPLCAQRQRIKLDPTVDREVFRKQRDLLKACGYRFDSTQQEWVCSS